jgi:hypothetical protein
MKTPRSLHMTWRKENVGRYYRKDGGRQRLAQLGYIPVYGFLFYRYHVELVDSTLQTN